MSAKPHLVTGKEVAHQVEERTVHIVDAPVIHRVTNYTVPHRSGPGPTGPAGATGGGGKLELPFVAADLVSTLNVGSIQPTLRVFKVQVDILSPFDNGVQFSVGIEGANSLLFELNVQDCATVESYNASMSKTVATAIILYPYYVTLPTTGSGILTIFYL
jgi:hypothetical protein